MNKIKILISALVFLSYAPQMQAEDATLQFDYVYRENTRTSNSTDGSDRSDYILHRGGKLEAVYYLVVDAEYNNRALSVLEGESLYSNLGRIYSASLVLPLEYFFIRADQNRRDALSYLDTPALGAIVGKYFFDDRAEFAQQSQSAGFRIPSWNLDFGGFAGSSTESREITQTLATNDLKYEIESTFKGYHFQKRPVDFDSFYMGLLYRDVNSSEITGETIADGAEQFYRLGKASAGWGFDGGSRVYYSASRKWEKKELELLIDGTTILDESESQGFNYGVLIALDNQALRMEKRVKTTKTRLTSPNYFSEEDFRTVGMTVGFRYDVELELTLELVSEFHRFKKSTDALDPTEYEIREFADDTLGIGFVLSFY